MGDGVFGVIEDLTSAVEKHLASALKNGGDHALEYFLTPSFEGNWKDFATAKELLGMNKDFKVCGRILRDVLIEAGVIKTVSPEKSKNEKSKPRKEK